jgi:hypothetical protein
MDKSLPKYEARDLSLRATAGFAIGIVGTLLLVFGAIIFFERGLNRARSGSERASRIGASERIAAAPVLQTDAAAELRALRSKEDAMLESYGWIDRKAGVIRIPIERAIELTAERGLPARKSPAEQLQ